MLKKEVVAIPLVIGSRCDYRQDYEKLKSIFNEKKLRFNHFLPAYFDYNPGFSENIDSIVTACAGNVFKKMQKTDWHPILFTIMTWQAANEFQKISAIPGIVKKHTGRELQHYPIIWGIRGAELMHRHPEKARMVKGGKALFVEFNECDLLNSAAYLYKLIGELMGAYSKHDEFMPHDIAYVVQVKNMDPLAAGSHSVL